MFRFFAILGFLMVLRVSVFGQNVSFAADTVYYFVDEPARFPGGENEISRFVARNLHYPEEARDNHIQGRVIVRFVVNTDGSISDLKLLNFENTELGNEALRIVKLMPKWLPAKHMASTVRQFVTIPIAFELE